MAKADINAQVKVELDYLELTELLKDFLDDSIIFPQSNVELAHVIVDPASGENGKITLIFDNSLVQNVAV